MLNGTDENKMKEMLKQAYDPETFRKTGHEIIDILSDYLADSLNRKGSVHSLKYNNPKDILKLWDNNFVNRNKETPKTVINKILKRSIHLHHPNNMGHQVAVSLPMAALSDLVSSLLVTCNAALKSSNRNIFSYVPTRPCCQFISSNFFWQSWSPRDGYNYYYYYGH